MLAIFDRCPNFNTDFNKHYINKTGFKNCYNGNNIFGYGGCIVFVCIYVCMYVCQRAFKSYLPLNMTNINSVRSAVFYIKHMIGIT